MRKQSKLTVAGKQAKAAAEREFLLTTLEAHDWNLTRTAEALDMIVPSVSRAIKELGLEKEHEAARLSGKLRPGVKAKKKVTSSS